MVVSDLDALRARLDRLGIPADRLTVRPDGMQDLRLTRAEFVRLAPRDEGSFIRIGSPEDFVTVVGSFSGAREAFVTKAEEVANGDA